MSYNSKEYRKAYNSYKKSAEHGNKRAFWEIGSMYGGGLGVEKNEYESFKWYKKAAEQGYVRGIASLGSCYLIGRENPLVSTFRRRTNVDKELSATFRIMRVLIVKRFS